MVTHTHSRSSLVIAIAAVFMVGATACSGDGTSFPEEYTNCPTGWQPNSTGEGCAPICAEGTLLNENETGCVPSEAASVSTPGADAASGSSGDSGGTQVTTPDTATGPDSPYIDCPTGWQPNSTGEGCAPVCAAGTELNDDEDGCVPIPDEPTDPPGDEDVSTPPIDPPDTDPGPDDTGTEPGAVACPAGYQEAEVDGTTVCVPATNITVHGYVLDTASGQGIAEATVTANALSDTALVTDETGYFEISGVTQVGSIAIYYAAEGYHSSYAWVAIQSAADYGSGDVFIEATAALVAVDQESVEVEPASDGWISGTVYAGDQPAVGATVRLRYESTGVEAGSSVTDATGAFMISEIAAAGHTFDLLVDNYDADGDGGYDYQGLTLDVGAINEGGTSSVNASNVVLVLEAIGKELSYANFTPPLTGVSGAGLNANLQFATPGGNLIFHFGAETQADTLIVSLVERIGGVISKYVDVVPSWNDSETVLTLNPAGLLTQDADPATDYELRIEALLWSDGSAFVPVNAGVAGAARFQFQVGEAPSYLTNPIPTIYTDNLGTDDQDVVLVSCDASACWLLDSQGFPIDGFVFPGEQFDPLGFINGEDGFQLTWSPVAGATDYKVYARQSYDGPEASGVQGWQELQVASLVTGFFSEGAPTTVYATGVLATGTPSWLDFGAIGPPGVGNTLAFGNMIQLAVTAVDEFGIESPINENKTLMFTDVTHPGIREVEQSNTDVTQEVTGHFDNIVSFGVRFTEMIEPGATASWSVTSNRIESMTQPSGVIWGNPDVFSGDNVDDAGSFLDVQLDMRWPCAIVTEDADGDATKVYLNDVSLFPTEVGIEVMFLSGNNAANLAHPGIRNVFKSDPSTGEIEFFNPLNADGGNGLSKGDFACTLLAQEDLSITSGAMFTDDSEPQVTTEESSLFHVGQQVLVASKQLNDLTTASALIYETVVTGMLPPIYNGDIPLSLGRLYLAGPPPQNYSNTLVFAKPNHTASFRKVTEMRLKDDVSTGPTDPSVSTLDVTKSSFESSLAMVDDLVLVDVDGDLHTLADQHWVTIAQLSTQRDSPDTADVDETDYEVTFGPTDNSPNAFPAVLELKADTTRIICLGDSFKLTGLEDTSGNSGLNPLLDQFSFCDGGFADCTGQGIFRY